MRKAGLLVLLSALLAACGTPGMVMAPLPAISDPAHATDVAVIRPTNFIASEFPFYIAIGEQNVAPIRSGENVRFSLPAGKQTIAIRCVEALSPSFKETRLDYEFAPKGQAFFVVAPKFDCATIEPIDARSAGGLIANTRTRTVEQAKRLDYQGTTTAKAVPPAPSVAVAAPMTKAVAQDAESVLKAREAALAARDLEALTALFADDAVVVATNGRLFSGREQIRPWLAEQVERRQREEAGPRASQGGKLTWQGKVYREDWQKLGVSPLYVMQEAIVEAGKIRFFNTTFTPESDARLRESRR